MEQLPQRIRTWLNARGITDEVIEEAQIGWSGSVIVIPIFDDDHNFLFNKYRRDPEVSEGAKYQYDKGGTSQLYQAHLLKKTKEVIICEGELDALILRSKGFIAVSTTGGSSTFEPDWVNYFLDMSVFICYDNDDPGFKGALQVQSLIPWAKVVWLPDAVGEAGDITDYFTKLSKTPDDFCQLLTTARQYTVPRPLEVMPETKKELDALVKADKINADELLVERRDRLAKYQPVRQIDLLSQYLVNRIAQLSKKRKYIGQKMNPESVNRLLEAKKVPVSNYIVFDRTNTAKCIWHNEDTPSMHYYEAQNRVKCFGCSKMGDVIDVVMELRKVELKEAIDIILSGK